MIKISLFKVLTVISFTFLAVLHILPNFININSTFLPNKSINLGLDLKGGSHLLLKVGFKEYLNDQLEIFSDQLRKEFRKNKIGYKNLRINKDELSFEQRNPEQNSEIKKLIRNIERSSLITIENNKIKISFANERLQQLKQNVIEQSIEIIRMRIDSAGTKEPNIQKQGDDLILLQVPGEDNPAYLKKLLGQTAKLSFHLVNNDISLTDNKVIPNDSVLVSSLNSDKEIQQSVVIFKKPIMTGDMLNDAQATYSSENNVPAVSFSLNNIGAKIFADFTRENRGRNLAIVLDNKLLSAPVINDPITGGRGTISGSMSLESASELALFLRAGALPAPLEVIEERTIGPSLGADSIESGKKAGIIGFIAVSIFMIWCYGILGIFAIIALILALLYIVSLITFFQATLTLPGIAAIILTIGMAVDANVLIYERIREVLYSKKSSMLYAIRQGFDTAFSTIADSNVTTLIAALMLFIFGSGAVKGFAVSLTIGICASMFSAIIVTKLLLDLWVKYFSPKNLGL